MMALVLFQLVTTLLINTFYCSAENVYCVTPTTTSCSSCPYNSTNCTTLSEYAQEAELYFTSNTTMVFLPGDHVLDTNIAVANVTRLTMCGESSSETIATVVRNGSVGFNFTNMVDLNIYSLAFTSYNRSWSHGSHPASNSALLLQSTKYAKLVNCSFHDNVGTALVVCNTNITLEKNNMFIHNQCACQLSEKRDLGCGISAFNSSITFTDNTTFLENSQTNSSCFNCSGAIWASASSLHFSGKNNFIGNSAIGTWSVGGAIYAKNNSLLSFYGTSNFSHNSADGGGAIILIGNVVLTFNGTSSFLNNSAKIGSGGAIYIGTLGYSYSMVTFNGINIFRGNSANSESGGAIAAVFNVSLNFKGASTFSHNSARHEGGAVLVASNALLTFNGTNNFLSNSVNGNGGAIFAVTNTSLSFTGTSSFLSNSAIEGGAISANSNSKLTFNGNVSFTDNGHNTDDSRGGAIYLAISSFFSILPHTTVHWQNNYANLGGAIFVLNSNPLAYCKLTRTGLFMPLEECFIQLPGQKIDQFIFEDINTQLVFKNNSADAAGSVLYGGAIDKCELSGLNPYLYNFSGVFDMLTQHKSDSTTSSISSDPFHVCPCENNHPNCGKSNMTLSVYPGETFQVSVVAVGQRDGIVPAAVRSNVERGVLLNSQYIQQTTKMCTLFNYTVFSQQDVSLDLHPDGPCSTFSDKLFLHLSISQSCPPGFSLQNSSLSCVCDQTLQVYTNHCDITNGSEQITRESGDTFWVGYDRSRGQVIVHPYCPFDYCVSDKVAFSLNSTKSDMQCAYNRSGMLCGGCKENYSLVLGTSQCKQCTNSHLVLLIPFAVMGVALVFLLFVCKLTVAAGTLSGLVFYANIVGMNHTTFLPVKSNDVLLVFLAWINLDFGIETCFFNGMDAYSYTWLQFAFPVYVFALVVLMILVGHYSQRFANLLGSNPVSVLATLILLSYTKILRTLITAVYFTYLKYPTYTKEVWLYDANMDYFAANHLSLFLVAVIIFIVLFFPYTLLLLVGQWLQAMSHLRFFSWVNRLKPFLDSYHAPYKSRHRYWPGLLLALRFVLLLVFAFNPQQDPSINLLAILVVAGILQLWAWGSGGVYKSWCLDALEGSFVLNMSILAAATYHVKHSGGDQRAAGYTSVIIALVTFIAILAYHIFQQIRRTKVWKKMPKLNELKTKQAVKEMNTPLNDLSESGRFDELREPWLEDLL